MVLKTENKKKKSWKKVGMAMGITSMLLLGACSDKPANQSTTVKVVNKKLNEEESLKVLEDFYKKTDPKSSEPMLFADKINLLNEHIGSLDKEYASHLIEYFMYSYYEEHSDLIDKMLSFEPSFQKFPDVDLTKKEDWKKFKGKDDTLYAFTQEVDSKMFKFTTNYDGSFAVNPKIEWIEKEYFKFINDDIKDNLINIKYQIENEFVVIEDGEQKLDLDVLERYITNAYEFEEKHKDSRLAISSQLQRETHEAVYLGILGAYTIDKDEKVKPEYVEVYKKKAEEFKGTKFGDIISIVLKEFEKNDFKVTSEMLTQLSVDIGHTTAEELEKMREEKAEGQ